MKNKKRIYLKNRKITFILVLIMFFSFISVASADTTQEITVTYAFYGPFWDINHDGVDNYLDISSLVSHYRETVPPRPPRYIGDYRWDITGDGMVNYLDVSTLVSHYREVWLVP
jgi:hypothetical protein